MFRSLLQNRPGQVALGAGVLASTIYGVMVFGTLAHLHRFAGTAPFDLRPGGYTTDQARTMLAALGDEGRSFYLTRQLVLDAAYPALLALTIAGALIWLRGRGAGPGIVALGIILAISAASADYVENIGIATMLVLGESAPDMVIQATSLATVTKSVLTTGAFVVVIIALGQHAGSRIAKACEFRQ